jgi:hypothetical protein
MEGAPSDLGKVMAASVEKDEHLALSCPNLLVLSVEYRGLEFWIIDTSRGLECLHCLYDKLGSVDLADAKERTNWLRAKKGPSKSMSYLSSITTSFQSWSSSP